MEKVTFNCDRCGEEVVGHVDEHFTAGYYNVGPGGAWHRFARADEARICDPCMWSDPEYQRIYAHDGEMQQWQQERVGG